MKILADWYSRAERIPMSILYSLPFAALLIFWVRGGNFDQLWMQRWVIVLVALTFVLAYKVSRVELGFAPFVFTTLFSGIVPAFWFNRYDHKFVENILSASNKSIDPENIWAIQSIVRQDCSRALFVFLLLFVVLRSFHKESLHYLKLALGLCGISVAVNILFLVAAGGRADFWVPWFDNPSMGACYIVLSLFAIDGAMKRQIHGNARASIWALGLAAVFATKTSAPLLALAAGGMAAYVLKYISLMKDWELPSYRNLLFGTLTILGGIGGVGYFMQGAQLWNNNSRFNMWSWYYEFWNRQDLFTHLFGLGLGSSRAFMPLAEIEHGMVGGWYFWLHNDWLQILFEQGAIGFAALLLAVGTLLYKARNVPCTVAFLFAFGATMLVNFPLHWPVHALLLACVLAPYTQKPTGENVCLKL
jgi:hypothetical protein